MDDFTLLQNYANTRCQQAFATLVSRYVNLVYSAALRQLGDHHRAEEATQAVFIVLANKAHAIGPKVLLGGWLLQTTSYAARNLLRANKRRNRHERKAAQMNPMIENDHASAQAWEQIAPLLDEGIRKLPAKARDAIILRYLEERSSEEVAQRLGISDQAARQRVSRAVELLREHFANRGVAVPLALVASLLAKQSVQAAPAGLAASSAALASTTTTVSSGVLTMILINKLKAVAAIILSLCVFAAIATAVLQAAIPPTTPAAPPSPAISNQPNIEITGVLLKPSGEPLADAEVFLADREHPVCIYGDTLPPTIMVLSEDHHAWATYFDRKPANKVRTTTNATGHFTFTVPVPPSKLPPKLIAPLPPAAGRTTTPLAPDSKPDPIYQIVARDPEGLVQIFVEDLPKSREIRLRPWGKIEGTLTISGKPRPDETLFLSRFPRLNDKTLMQVVHDQTIRTDADGHFTIDHVAPGDVWITRRLRPQDGAITHFAYVDVQPGSTSRVTLGGGQTITGTLTQPKDFPQPLIWQDHNNWTEVEIQSLPIHDYQPTPDWYNLTASQQSARMEEWGRTKDGQAYKDNLFKLSAIAAPDGSFTIPDLAPGKYQLSFRTTQGPDLSEAVASLDRTLDVEKNANPNDALNLGSLEVKVQPLLHVGDRAPRFECQTLQGQPLKLDAYNGKYVLLYFCEADMESRVNYFKSLQEIHAAYANDNRLAIITLQLDPNLEQAKNFTQNKNLPWPQGYIGRDSKIQSDYHANSALIFLIGPDGKVLARHLANESLPRAIAAALGKPK